jgi:hypothetical protein
MSNNRNYSSHKNVRLYTNKQNSKSIVNKFAEEFGYEEMFYDCSINKKSIIIEESTLEIIDELESFSKKHINHEITIEYVSGNQYKITKTVKLEAGKVLETINHVPQSQKQAEHVQNQNKPEPKKHIHNNQNKPQNQEHKSKPQTNKPKPNRNFHKKDNNFKAQRNHQNKNKNQETPIKVAKPVVIEDVTEKKQLTRNLKFKNNAA